VLIARQRKPPQIGEETMDYTTTPRLLARVALVGSAAALFALIATRAERFSSTAVRESADSAAAAAAADSAQSPLPGVRVMARDVRDLFPH